MEIYFKILFFKIVKNDFGVGAVGAVGVRGEGRRRSRLGVVWVGAVRVRKARLPGSVGARYVGDRTLKKWEPEGWEDERWGPKGGPRTVESKGGAPRLGGGPAEGGAPQRGLAEGGLRRSCQRWGSRGGESQGRGSGAGGPGGWSRGGGVARRMVRESGGLGAPINKRNHLREMA